MLEEKAGGGRSFTMKTEGVEGAAAIRRIGFDPLYNSIAQIFPTRNRNLLA